MKLRLFIEKFILEINIKLREGYIPSMSGYTYTGKFKVIDEKPTEFLEPAVWFKIYLMDTLTIDCNCRSVYWTPKVYAEEISDAVEKVVEENDDVDELLCETFTSENLYDRSYKLGDDCVDYFNDLDEVYDVLPSMLSMYKNDKMTKAEFYKSLIKLIHVNVLPNVKVTPENLDLLKKCFHAYKKYMKLTNDLIAAKTSQLTELKTTKLRERQKFLQMFNNSSKEPKIYEDLMDLLEVEYNKDLERVAYDFKKLQMDYIRSVCDKVPLESTSKMMNKVDSMKDEIVGLNKVLENIRKMKNRSGLSKMFFRLNSPHGEEAFFQDMYLKMKETEDLLQKKVYRVMDKKLMLLTVCENMRNVIQELIEGFESYGVDFDTKSRMKSNILAETCVSIQWKSLPEHVNIILSNPDHDITKDHYSMMKKVKDILMETLKKYTEQCQYNSIVPQIIKKHLFIHPPASNNTLDNTSNNDIKNDLISKLNDSGIHDTAIGGPEIRNVIHLTVVSNGRSRKRNRVSQSCFIRTHSTNDLTDLLVRPSVQRFHSLTSVRVVPSVDEISTPGKNKLTSKPTFKSHLEDEKFFKNNDFGYVMETIQQLKPLIADHFKSICMKLNLEIDKSYYRQNFRKIWVIYENYFYEHILGLILDLYRAQFASKTEVLTEWIFKLTLEDLDMSDTQTTRLLLESSDDESCLESSEDIGDAKDITENAGTGADGATNEIEFSGSSGSLINAIIEGLTTQEDVFYENQAGDAEGEHKKNGAKKFKDVATAIDKVLKAKVKAAKIPNHEAFCSKTLPAKVHDSGLESCGPTNHGQHGNDHSFLPNTIKPKSEKRYFSTSVKPESFDVDKYIFGSNSRTIKMKPSVMNRFLKAYSHMKIALTASTPLVKTHHMCRCLKEVTNQLTQLHKEIYKTSLIVCNDELMDGLIILVCNLDQKEIVSDLYIQLQLMTDTLADLFEAGEYRFALVMFQGVCQYLQDKTMMKKNKGNYGKRT